MLRNFTRRTLTPVLALTLFFASCDQVGEVTGPGADAPSQSLLGIDVLSAPKYTVVRENDPAVGVVTGIIGSGGGKLSLGRHELQVPAGAVSGPTTFTMSKLTDELKVELTATQLLTNDVGSRGFAVPVKLVLNIAQAKDVSDPSKLRVFWKKLDGSYELQNTQVDVVGKRAIGHLNHFSEYVLAVP